MLSPAEVFSWAAKTAAVPKYIGQINRNAKECNKFAFKHERQLLGGFAKNRGRFEHAGNVFSRI